MPLIKAHPRAETAKWRHQDTSSSSDDGEVLDGAERTGDGAILSGDGLNVDDRTDVTWTICAFLGCAKNSQIESGLPVFCRLETVVANFLRKLPGN